MSEDLFELTQRLIIEHAHRLAFGAVQDPQVVDIRPRVVNSTMFRAEGAQWERRHQEQSDAERDTERDGLTRRGSGPAGSVGLLLSTSEEAIGTLQEAVVCPLQPPE